LTLAWPRAPRGHLSFLAGQRPVSAFNPQRLAAGGSLFIPCPTLNPCIPTRNELLRRAGDLFAWIASAGSWYTSAAPCPLTDAARAHTDLAASHTTGKLLLP